MSVSALPNPANSALARTVEKRVRADASFISARATMWKLLGVGGLLGLTGAGIGAALFGYSYVADARSSAEKIAAALALAFDKTTLKTEGMVAVKEGGTVALTNGEVRITNPTVALEPGARVSIADGGTVALARGSKVGVEGDLGAYRPSAEQMRGAGGAGAGGGNVVTNFTVFKEARLGKGVVTTGWKYTSNEQVSPANQFCYYAEGTEDANVNVFIAHDGKLDPPTDMRAKVNYRKLAQNCIWFDGAPTRDF